MKNNPDQSCCGSSTVIKGTPSHEEAVRRRYAESARQVEDRLCCATQYDARYLAVIPEEIIRKDYGCGDPSRYVSEGETVLDLGSGAGKICYILSQKVGSQGQIIGVDFNDAMLEVARKYQDSIAAQIGHGNVRFVKGRIQDLALDLEQAQQWLDAHPPCTVEDLAAYDAQCERLRRETPMIADESVDVVVSNCVLNLVRPDQKDMLFREIYRVLKPGGRAVISDIVCDRDPTPEMREDPELWSGCISGAFREDRFPAMFEAAGFHGIEIMERQRDPWQVVEGIQFRPMVIRASKSTRANGSRPDQTLVYRGPWKKVIDDHGRVFVRGEATALTGDVADWLGCPTGPFASHFLIHDTAASSSKCCSAKGSSCC